MAKKKPNEPKKYSFSREERWFVLEHNSFISFYNNLVKSYVEQIVIPRAGIKLAEDEQLRISPDADGVEVVKTPKAKVDTKIQTPNK